MSSYLIGLLTGFCAGVALGVTGLTLVDYYDHGQPDCPTEDSCVTDYRDGAWYVTEVTP